MNDLVRTQILLERKQRYELDEIAEKEGVSFSEVVRKLLEAQLRQRKYAEMRLAAEELRDEYSVGGELTDMTALDGEDFNNV